MRTTSSIFILLLVLSFLPRLHAEAFSGVVISEIAWMGESKENESDTNYYNREWIELYGGDSGALLDGWQIVTADGTPKPIALSGTLAPGAFLVFRRGTESDYVGALHDDGEYLQLIHQNGDLVDSIDATDTGWPAGSKEPNEDRRTMERALDGSWVTSIDPGGTPEAKNSVWQPVQTEEPPQDSNPPAEEPSAPPDETTSPPPVEEAPPPPPLNPEETPVEPVSGPQVDETSTETAAAPQTLRLSELLPDPEGKDSEDEFVEVENFGTETVILDGWKIRDASGRTLTLTDTLEPGALAVFFAGGTSLPNLNNDGDILELLDPEGARRDGIQYGATKPGFALARKSDGEWAWTSSPTPGRSNVFSPASETEAASVDEAATPKKAQSDADVVVAPLLSTSAESPKSEADATVSPTFIIPKATSTKTFSDLALTPPDNDGTSLAAALRETRTDAQPQERALLTGLLFALATGGAVFLLRVFSKRRREPAFVVEEDEDET